MGSEVRNKQDTGTEAVGDILSRVLRHAFAADPSSSPSPQKDRPARESATGRYDFDLAEFPIFRFGKPGLAKHGREPLLYTDTIRGQDGRPVTRTWKAYPGSFGFGGASAQVLFYDLLQLYAEQGGRGSQIQFGTLRSLFLRRGHRNPSKRDYDRLRRDLDVLRGYDFHCTNAFWDARRRAYVDMKWRLFGSVFFFKPHPDDPDRELPFGFIEISPVLQQVAESRGFFSLGFGSELYHSLRPLEQRLAVYLAKKFVSQRCHRRRMTDLAQALPIEAIVEKDARKTLRSAAEGLLKKRLPILAGFRFEHASDGGWLAVFDRAVAPAQDTRPGRPASVPLDPAATAQVDRIVAAVGSDSDRLWWAQCVRRLGPGPVDRALGLLKEARQAKAVRNPGGLLTTILKRVATEMEILLS
jgi:hypothetical protein